MAKNIIYTATLVGGQTFVIGSVKFEKGKKREVSKQLYDYIQKADSCFYNIMVDDKPEKRNRFELGKDELEVPAKVEGQN